MTKHTRLLLVGTIATPILGAAAVACSVWCYETPSFRLGALALLGAAFFGVSSIVTAIATIVRFVEGDDN